MVKARKAPAKRKPAKPGSRKGDATSALNRFGMDKLCERVADGKPLTAIAKEVGVSKGSLLAWLAADPDRSARAREARSASARGWDELAEEEIRKASDPFELGRARELAQHYRWRASKIAPKDYGDKVQLADADGDKLPAPTVTVHLVRPG